MRQTELCEIDQGAAAEIDHQRQVRCMGEGRQLGFGHRGSETRDHVIAGVHFHDQRAARCDGSAEIGGMGAIGSADFDQACTGARHDIGDAESTADLDQLTARHYDFFLSREGVQSQEHCGGIVVDHRRRFGAGQATDPLFNVHVTIAASATGQVVFQIARTRCNSGHRRNGFRRQGRATEIGMQHRAGQIEHAFERGREQGRELTRGAGQQSLLATGRARELALAAQARPRSFNDFAQHAGHQLAPTLTEQRLQGLGAQQFVDRRNGAQQRVDRLVHRPWNTGRRFSMKARIASLESSDWLNWPVMVCSKR